MTSSLTAATDSTISIGCSDVTENTYVLLLEWRCRGECSEGGRETLVKFTRGRGAGSQRDPRYSLNEENFDLTVTGVRLEDAGDYFCLVNNKVEGQDIVKLNVVGKKSTLSETNQGLFHFFSSSRASFPTFGHRIRLEVGDPDLVQAPAQPQLPRRDL